MRKMMLFLTIIAMIICCVSCAVKQEETADFAVPTPAAEETEPTPTPEPVPTEKPRSEYNEKLAKVDGFAKPEVNWVNPPHSKLYSVTDAADVVALVCVESKAEEVTMQDWGGNDGHTDAVVRIEKLWKNHSDLKEGDRTTVRERCYLIDYEDGTIGCSTWEDYYPMREHAYYLLFLEKHPEEQGVFIPGDLEYSKFPVTPALDDAMKAGKVHYKHLETAKNPWVYPGQDRNLPWDDMAALFADVYKEYYNDEAILRVLEEERAYEEHYGAADPVEWFESPPEGEDILWAYAYMGENVIYVPAERINDGASLGEIHAKMNEIGFDAAQLQTLDVDSSEFRMWINGNDVDLFGDRKEQFGAAYLSVFDLDGACIAEDLRIYDCMHLIKDRGFEPVVISVTERADEDADALHAFFIADVDESKYLF